MPGVVDAAVIDRAPFFIGYDRMIAVWPDGGTCDETHCPKVSTLFAGDGYFRAMGIRMTAGREFDGTTTGAIVNQAFAKQQWPDGRGLGETIRIGANGAVLTVIGVTAAHRTRGLDREAPTLYLPINAEAYEGVLTVVARTA